MSPILLLIFNYIVLLYCRKNHYLLSYCFLSGLIHYRIDIINYEYLSYIINFFY